MTPIIPAGEWTIHGSLLAILLLGAVAYVIACARFGMPSAGRQSVFAAGWLAALGAVAAPGGILQLGLLTLVAAPLMAGGLSPRMRAALPANGAAAAAGIFALVLWYWHVPGPQALAETGGLAETAKLLTLLAGALNLWRALFSRPDRLAAALVTGLQLAALGVWQSTAGQPDGLVFTGAGILLLALAAGLAAMPFAPAPRAGFR